MITTAYVLHRWRNTINSNCQGRTTHRMHEINYPIEHQREAKAQTKYSLLQRPHSDQNTEQCHGTDFELLKQACTSKNCPKAWTSTVCFLEIFREHEIEFRHAVTIVLTGLVNLVKVMVDALWYCPPISPWPCSFITAQKTSDFVPEMSLVDCIIRCTYQKYHRTFHGRHLVWCGVQGPFPEDPSQVSSSCAACEVSQEQLVPLPRATPRLLSAGQ